MPAEEADRLKRRGLYVDMDRAGRIREPSEITDAEVTSQLARARQAADSVGLLLAPQAQARVAKPPADTIEFAQALVSVVTQAGRARTPEAAVDVMLNAVSDSAAPGRCAGRSVAHLADDRCHVRGLAGASGRLAARIGPRPPLVAGCLLCAAASILAVRIGPHAGYRTAVFPLAVLFGLGLASLLPPLTATAMNSAPDSLAGLASGVTNAVARAAGLLWIAALPPITGLTGAAYTDPVEFRSSFAQISWICAAAFGCAAALAATFITGPRRPTPPRRPALIQTPVPHLTCPVAFRRAIRSGAPSARRRFPRSH